MSHILKLRILVFSLMLASFASRAEDPFEGIRARMKESCSSRKRWSAPIRLKGTRFEVGRMLWACPSSFRLIYQGPGAFEYSSNGVEAWVARPSFSARGADIEHYWRLTDTDLHAVLAYLRGEDSRLPALKQSFKAAYTSRDGIWSVTLTPYKKREFASMSLEWKISSGDLSGVQWVSPEGLVLNFEIGKPEALAGGTASADVVPKLPAGARVIKYPVIKKEN